MREVCRVSLLCLASALAAIGGVREAEASCTNTAPTSNETVICDGTSTTPVSAAAGSTNVSVTVLPGAALNTGVRAIGVVDNSTVLDQGAISTRLNNAFGISTTGDGSTLNNQGTIITTGSGSFGLDARGSNSTMINSGTINVSGANAGGIRSNEAAGSTLIVNSGTITTATGPGILGANANITVRNSGDINAGNGIAMQLGDGNNVIEITGGQINGAIVSGAGNDQFTMSGGIVNGDVNLGGGSSAFTITGGQINGNILSSGPNTVTLFTGSTITGAVEGGGADALMLDGAGSGLLTGAVSNFQTLTKVNTGTWELTNSISGATAVAITGGTLILSGANTYTGPTTVAAGVLIVNGSIASSSLTTVNSGAALFGTGTVGSTVVNAGGFLVPGNSPGTMTVAGNLALQSGAFYIVQVNPTTASTTNVSGTASLAGTVGGIFAPGSYVTRSYTILTAAGGVSGRFDAGAVRGLPAGFRPSLSYTGNAVVLNLTAQLVPRPTSPTTPTPTPFTSTLPPVPGLPVLPEQPSTAPPLPPFTTNQLNVGLAIDNFFNNGGALPPAFVPLFDLTGSSLTNALDQLSGEPATGAQKVAFQLTDQFLNVMLDPFVDGRSGVGGADHPALGFAPERKTMPPDIAHAYASVLKAPQAPAPVYEPRWTAWGGAYGGSNRTIGDLAITGSHDLSARTAGFTSGLDYRVTPDTVVGFALAGGGTGWSLANSLGGGKSDAFQAGVYGATRSGPAYLAAAFAFTNHWMSTDRVAVGDHLTADFKAQSYGGRLEGGYRFGMPFGGITPYAAIQAQSFHTPGFTETDGIANGFALGFGSRDATDTRSELGARFDRMLAVYSNAVLALRARVAWAHDRVSDPTLLPAFQALPGASSFIVNGATPAKNSALTSAGAELRLANGVTLLAKFDGEFASHSSTYAGTGTVRYRW